ncbi:hypothetical protein LINGRAHAP2_LOCUS21974 [Linum grandiflorum]
MNWVRIEQRILLKVSRCAEGLLSGVCWRNTEEEICCTGILFGTTFVSRFVEHGRRRIWINHSLQ